MWTNYSVPCEQITGYDLYQVLVNGALILALSDHHQTSYNIICEFIRIYIDYVISQYPSPPLNLLIKINYYDFDHRYKKPPHQVWSHRAESNSCALQWEIQRRLPQRSKQSRYALYGVFIKIPYEETININNFSLIFMLRWSVTMIRSLLTSGQVAIGYRAISLFLVWNRLGS